MAIDDLLDEHEQGERVRAWLRRNGAGMVSGILLGLALIGGWQWWQKREQDAAAVAGGRYDAAVKAFDAKDLAKGQAEIAALKGTTYGVLGALELAKSQVDAGQQQAAITTLRAVQGDVPQFTPLINQRLARLLIDTGKPEEAITLLAGVTDVEALQIQGDAELAAGKRDAARQTYGRALTLAEVGSPQRRLLELKLSEVGGSAAQPEAKS